MLEIIALYYLCKKMGEILRAKGWTKPVWMQVAVVATWFGSMVVGLFCYGIYLGLRDGEAAAENPGFIAYPIAWLSAGIGTGLLFLIANSLSARQPPPVPSVDRPF